MFKYWKCYKEPVTCSTVCQDRAPRLPASWKFTRAVVASSQSFSLRLPVAPREHLLPALSTLDQILPEKSDVQKQSATLALGSQRATPKHSSLKFGIQSLKCSKDLSKKSQVASQNVHPCQSSSPLPSLLLSYLRNTLKPPFWATSLIHFTWMIDKEAAFFAGAWVRRVSRISVRSGIQRDVWIGLIAKNWGEHLAQTTIYLDGLSYFLDCS